LIARSLRFSTTRTVTSALCQKRTWHHQLVLGKVGAPNAAVYAASKHAVEGLTKAAALEGAATGVRVIRRSLPECRLLKEIVKERT
jgi:NADP-dependent 3-hydroxy acid dehydrogenase YdfG